VAPSVAVPGQAAASAAILVEAWGVPGLAPAVPHREVQVVAVREGRPPVPEGLRAVPETARRRPVARPGRALATMTSDGDCPFAMEMG